MHGSLHSSVLSNQLRVRSIRFAPPDAGLRDAVIQLLCLLSMFLHSSLLLCPLLYASSPDWNGPAQQLAQKIAAFTGPCTVAFTVQNRSSLSAKDVETITADLRAQLEAQGVHSAELERSAGSATVFLSENPESYVWVAEMQVGDQSGVVLISPARAEGAAFLRDAPGMTLRKIPIFAQEDRILDLIALEEDGAPNYIAVLGEENVTLYRRQNTKWQKEQSLAISHEKPWPRDVRGRLVAAKDHLIDVYLPGVFCRSTNVMPLSLTCKPSDDPWPLNLPSATSPSTSVRSVVSTSAPALRAFYTPSRNYFTGALTPAQGNLSTVAKFYSAVPLPREKYTLWLFAGVDGQIHVVDGMREQAAKLGWGSDIASLRTACGSGWQVLATGAANGVRDTVRAYELPDRDPVPVSAPLEVPGEITALWTESKGDSAVAIVRNQEVADYEAFRLAVVCSQ